MTLMNAAGLWLLAFALPIVLLYVLKSRRRRVSVPSTWLWGAARRDLSARTPWQKLRRELPLVLELLALAALALAVAGPACRGRSIVGRHVAIVLDTSASMDARDEGTGRARMDDARDAARRVVDALAPGADAMVIGAGRDARVLAPLGRDRAALRAAIDAARAQQVEGDVGTAVALALDRLRALTGDRRVVVVSDGGAGGAQTIRASGSVPIQLVRVGHAQDNAGIVRMDVRTARGEHSDADEVQAFVLLANHSLRARDVYVTARRDGDAVVLASRRLRLEPAAREPVALGFPFRAEDTGRGLVVEVSPGDALRADDVAYGTIPPGPSLPVLLITSGAPDPWIERALRADPHAALTETADPSAAVRAPRGSLVVFAGVCPAALPEGRDVAVFAPPAGHPCAGLDVGASVDAPAITSFAVGDPRLRFLSLDGVHIVRATPIGLGGRATSIVSAAGAALIADASSPDRAVTLVGFDVGDSDWPLRASWVLFVRNLEELARAHRARAASGGGRAGEPLRIAVPPDVREVTVRSPSGTARVPVTAGSAIVGETSRIGLYTITWRGGGVVAAVDLLSDAESDLRAAPFQIEGAPAVDDVHALVRPHEDLTPIVALVAALLLLANVAWLTRRPRVPRAPPLSGIA